MQIANFIAVDDFCNSWNIEMTFISSLQEMGLIEFVVISETTFINISLLPQLEKLIRFHYELDINLEGIETIMHLLQRIETMHDEINDLRNKLRLFERSET